VKATKEKIALEVKEYFPSLISCLRSNQIRNFGIVYAQTEVRSPTPDNEREIA